MQSILRILDLFFNILWYQKQNLENFKKVKLETFFLFTFLNLYQGGFWHR